MLCKFIIDVYLLKDLLSQGGEHTFIQKNESISYLSIYDQILWWLYTAVELKEHYIFTLRLQLLE